MADREAREDGAGAAVAEARVVAVHEALVTVELADPDTRLAKNTTLRVCPRRPEPDGLVPPRNRLWRRLGSLGLVARQAG